MPTFSFDFSDGDFGWVAGFADYNVEDSASFELKHGYRPRPASLGSGGSLFISGMNRSDDLFMFHKKRLTGLEPGIAYHATFGVELASKYVSALGVGGDPAKSVYVKACVATFEPRLIPSHGTHRLDIDIGRQSHAGKDSVLLGNIEKPGDAPGDYALIERSSSEPFACTAADDGAMWVLFGTDSGYEGETALYYTAFECCFHPAR